MSLSDRTIYIFTPEVFEVVGSPTITNDGIASGFSDTDYIKVENLGINSNVINFETKFIVPILGKECVLLLLQADTTNRTRMIIGHSTNFILFSDSGALTSPIKIPSSWVGDTVISKISMQKNGNTVSLFNITKGVTLNSTSTKISNLSFGRVVIGLQNQESIPTSIDLKQFSISVDGEEVFSGSRKIKLGTPVLDDSEHLPKVVTNVLGIDDILLAIDPEVQLLRVDISDLIKELYVKTTDKFIRRWENDFSLPYDSSLTLQQRRQRILNKLARKKTLTWQNLKLLIRNNIDNPQFYIMNDSKNYHFTIMVQTPNYNELTKALDETIPAYLTYDIIVTEYFKRCGTFVSGTNPL